MKQTPVLRVLQILGLNAVPAAGFFGAGWSSGTTLLLYWLEGILIALLISVRIILHRKATRKRGHYRTSKATGRSPRGGTLLQSFLWVVIPFNLAHGVFLMLILFLFLPQMIGGEDVGIDFRDLRTGFIGMTVFLSGGLLLDVFSLEKRPFRWIEQLVERSLGRVGIVHLSILFGMAAIAFWEAPRTFFMAFVALKTMTDLSWLLPQGQISSEPPAWLAWVSRFDKETDDETFAEYWQRTHEADERIRRENEEVSEQYFTG